MGSKPLVSIIIRTKDRPKLLKRALQSVSAQIYRPMEVVLVNDGGCELDVEEVKSTLGDVFLNYIRLEKNTGRAHAGNLGIENAKGKYVGFLDDDDEFYPEHVEVLAAFLEQSDYKAAYTDTEMIFKHFDGETLEIGDAERLVFSKDFSYHDLIIENYIPFNSLLFLKKAMDSVGGLNENYELYEDWDFLIRAGQKFPFFHINRITAKYNQWSKDLQINKKNDVQMKTLQLKVIDRHKDKISSDFILDIWDRSRRLDPAVTERIAAIRVRDEAITERDNAIRARDEAIKERDETITERDRAFVERDRQTLIMQEKLLAISELNKLLSQKDDHILQLESSILGMRETLGWKLLESARKLRERLLPAGKRRRKIYDLGIKSLKVIKNDGFGVFVRKGRNKINKLANEELSQQPVCLNVDSASALVHFPSKRHYSVLFLKCEWAGITNHYRVYNMVEYLKAGGIYTNVLDLNELPAKASEALKFDLVIIHRVPMTPFLNAFIAKCRELRTVAIFDIDDYLFEPSVIHLIEWVKHTGAAEREGLIEHLRQCRETLDACDYFISPTEFLSNKAGHLGKKAYVIRNGFSGELLQAFSKAFNEKSGTNDGIVRVGYFSGTNTHQKDFLSVAPAILRIMREYNNVNLYICGLLELDYQFDEFRERIERSPLVPLDQLPYHLFRTDINIAPLERENIFCEAKSELKYMYAGILKIPTVATPTDAFRHAIHHGDNGFLATNLEEWYTCLKTLLEDTSLRKEMGERAYINVRDGYTPEILADRVKDVYESIIDSERQRSNIPESGVSVNFLVSDVADRIDEYENLVQLCEILSQSGHLVRIYFFRTENGSLPKVSQAELTDSKVVVVRGMDNILSSDILVCTDPHNSSVVAYQNRNWTSKLAYLALRENCEEIPYPWAGLFKVIPFSSNKAETVSEIEGIAWDTTDLKKF